MLHPRRFLQDLVDGELSDRRRIAVERHVSRCSSCTATVTRLRSLKSDLLGLASPVPDADFQRRLLDPGSDAAGTAHASHAGSSPVSLRLPEQARRQRGHRRRSLIAAAGGSAVVATTVLTSAYLVGSEAESVSAEGAAGSTALRAGWESVAPHTPTSLDTDQLDTLRAGGWYCPELESLGFTLQNAEGITVRGLPTLALVLENDGERVTVYEQRKVSEAKDVDGVPVSAVTGNLVTSDGFEYLGGTGRDVWVRSGTPWQVVLDSPAVTYTVVSDMPAVDMPPTLSQLVTTEHAQLSVAHPEQDDSMMGRIIRGLS